MIQYSIVLTAFQYVNHILHGILWTAIRDPIQTSNISQYNEQFW